LENCFSRRFVVGKGDQVTVTVYEDGKVIDNFTLPEGGNCTWETSDYGIHNGIPPYLYPSSHASSQMVLSKQDVPDAPLSHFIQVTIHWEVFFM